MKRDEIEYLEKSSSHEAAIRRVKDAMLGYARSAPLTSILANWDLSITPSTLFSAMHFVFFSLAEGARLR